MDKKYFVSIDYLRALAIFAVVGIHTSTQTFAASGYDAENYTVSIFINQILRFAVPLFFALSGFSLSLNYKEGNILAFYKKRVSKIILPFIFWSFIYYQFIYKSHGENFIEALLKGSSSYQLYFIPSLLILYFLFPIFHILLPFLKNKAILALIFLVEMYLLYLDYFIKPLEINHSFKIAILNFFIFLLGILAAKNYKFLIKFVDKYKYLFIASVVVMGLYVFYEGSGLFKKSGNYLDIYSQWRPSVLIYTIFIGVTLLNIFEKQGFVNKILNLISRLSFFIYFVHIIVLELFWKYIGQYFYNIPLFDVVFLVSIFLMSLTCGFICHKIPKLKHLTG